MIMKIRGFSLLELCIVLAIIAILSSQAFPLYQSHLIKARRAEGQVALFHLASAMEKYAVEHQGYQQATFEALKVTPDLPYYRLQIIRAEENHFLIAAAPLKSQTKDNVCGVLAMNDKGEKGKLVGDQVKVDKGCW